MNDKNLRQSLVEVLKGGLAHSTMREALVGIDPPKRNRRPQGFSHSLWEVLEHMRLAQEDILRYTLDANWVSPAFPSGYWPQPAEPMQESDWQKTVAGFFADLEETIKLAEDESFELTAEIPHGNGHTYLREILLIADHNAHHLGQLIQLRKALQDWPS
ncbi:MAG: DinB family protein [Acidobacteria bacterium]|nr:DinB family protein [Acidobacteriota bacterium]